MITPAQVKRIHTLKSRARLDEPEYRAMLAARGVASSKGLTIAAANGLIADLERLPPAVRPSARAQGRYAPILQALWIAGWNLGVVRDRRDSALIAFVERQTGLSHTRFLADASDARKAIEGLKSWLAREAGIDWPAGRDHDDTDATARKRAILAAQIARCAALGIAVPALPPVTIENFVVASNALGERIRAASKAKKEGAR